MNKRTRRTLLGVAAVLLLLAVAIFLRSKAPPEAARLLPESDGIIYVNLRPVHTFFKGTLRPPQRVPEYEQFVRATGIDWERDLDEAAIALHRMPDADGPNGPVAYSMVLVGKLTGARLNSWLDSHASSRESYAGHTIYNVPSEARTVRVAQVGYDMVAVSNTPTPEQIHSMLDRHRTAALPFAGSTLLSQHFHEVPLLSLAWGVGQIGLPFNESGAISVLGFRLPLQSDSTIIASLSPELTHAGSLRLRVDEIAPTDEAAASQAASLTTLVNLARGFTVPLGGNTANRGLKELLRTAEVNQKRNRVLITATVPGSIFTGLASGDNSSAQTEPAPPSDASK
ncbi:MAG TPA: hypothetical protein VGG85_18255 [Terracidiphilus sp.]|jgi:hypothetical protein